MHEGLNIPAGSRKAQFLSLFLKRKVRGKFESTTQEATEAGGAKTRGGERKSGKRWKVGWREAFFLLALLPAYFSPPQEFAQIFCCARREEKRESHSGHERTEKLQKISDSVMCTEQTVRGSESLLLLFLLKPGLLLPLNLPSGLLCSAGMLESEERNCAGMLESEGRRRGEERERGDKPEPAERESCKDLISLANLFPSSLSPIQRNISLFRSRCYVNAAAFRAFSLLIRNLHARSGERTRKGGRKEGQIMWGERKGCQEVREERKEMEERRPD